MAKMNNPMEKQRQSEKPGLFDRAPTSVTVFYLTVIIGFFIFIKSLMRQLQEAEEEYEMAREVAACFVEDMTAPFCTLTAVAGWVLVLTGWGDDWQWLHGLFNSDWDWMGGLFGGFVAGMVIAFFVYGASRILPWPFNWLADKIGYWRW